MSLSIKITNPSEAEELSQIQKAAFKPLYEKYHDEGNPFLRGPEDILRRLNKFNRHFTILYDDKVVGGVFYRLYGKRSSSDEIGAGEYYLARIYIHPDYQNKGIARDAILLCEKEFPDARFYYVDFPEDMEKNRRCYQSAGYCDTGDRICIEGAPALAMFKKTASDVFEPAGVTLPMIYEVDKNELQECLDVIHQSFSTVAEQFGLTQENCPKHTSFIPLSILETQMNWGWHMCALYAGKKVIGYMSLSKESEDVYELHNLAVLPEYRHNGFGKLLLEYAKEAVRSLGGNTIKIGIIEESIALKNWYIANGFVHTGTKKFDHLPFTSGYLEWKRK
ncbi:MAG: GNAT family N-acetyltransferase [Clostridiales bacterium]|nr:GNAT family N-acetyltransferase [Clostridiales bacterium]